MINETMINFNNYLCDSTINPRLCIPSKVQRSRVLVYVENYLQSVLLLVVNGVHRDLKAFVTQRSARFCFNECQKMRVLGL